MGNFISTLDFRLFNIKDTRKKVRQLTILEEYRVGYSPVQSLQNIIWNMGNIIIYYLYIHKDMKEHECWLALTRFLSTAYADGQDKAHSRERQEGKDNTLLTCDLNHSFKVKIVTVNVFIPSEDVSHFHSI